MAHATPQQQLLPSQPSRNSPASDDLEYQAQSQVSTRPVTLALGMGSNRPCSKDLFGLAGLVGDHGGPAGGSVGAAGVGAAVSLSRGERGESVEALCGFPGIHDSLQEISPSLLGAR